MGDPFDLLRNEKVTLVKASGERLEGIPALVGDGSIEMPETSLAIEDGDTLLRRLPSGVVEEYEVLDSGYTAGLLALPANYQARVRKKTAISRQPPRQVVFNVHMTGPNARFNLNSEDLSTNVVDVAPDELFEKLKEALTAGVEDLERRRALILQASELAQAVGKPTFQERYKSFVSSAADHMTLLAPFLPALTQLL